MKKLLILALTLLFSVCNCYSQKKLIAFSSDATKNDQQQIFIMDEDGDGVTQLTNLELDCYAPKFSIDGNQLMYRSEKDENNAIYIMDMTTGESFPISDGSLATHAEFSHDGSKVIYSSSAEQNFDLVVLNLLDTTDNAQQTVVATKDAEIYGTFSPDGQRLAFSSFDINYKGTLKICDDKGKNVKVVSSGGSSYNAKFSPDGKLLAYLSNKSGNLELYVCSADGSGSKQISTNRGNTIEYEWSSDSKKVVCDDQKEGVSSVWIIEVETGSRQNLTSDKANNITPTIQR